MIDLAPYDTFTAKHVFDRLDPYDLLEARMVRGGAANHLQIFAEWHAVQATALVSLVLHDKPMGTPFAVLALGHTGQAGVAQAALLARLHSACRRPLAQAGVLIRRRMPAFCAEAGVQRIEARCWAGHPTASSFLSRCGFTLEADMPGFGPEGRETFRQFAWTPPNHGDDPCAS